MLGNLSLENFSHFNWIGTYAPCFKIHGDNVKILQSPGDFYTELITNIQQSQRRVVLSALYLGTGDLEQQLVTCLDEKLLQCKAEGKNFTVDVLLDYCRGSRGDTNSKTMLLPLIEKYAEDDAININVFLYHTPLLRGPLKKILPNRWNEIVGVQHMKVNVFDDNVLLTGANLSRDYFKQRQDRYMVFNECPSLADHFHSLVKAVGSFSYSLLPNGSCVFSKEYPELPSNSNLQSFSNFMQKKLQPFSMQTSPERPLDQPQSMIYNLVDKVKSFVTRWSGYSHLDDSNFINNFNCIKEEGFRTHYPEPEHGKWDTLVFPTVQLGFANILQDQFIFSKLLNSLDNQHVTFASGYFNMTHEYSKLVAESTAGFEFLTASPEANGFLGGSGLSGQIPYVYIYLTKVFYSLLSRHNRLEDVKIQEYFRQKWTFHAKGLWVSQNQFTNPYATVIGSSNFGARSVYRDLEAQATLITSNKGLMEKLNAEKRAIQYFSIPVTAETFKHPRYKTSLFINLVSPIIKRLF